MCLVLPKSTRVVRGVGTTQRLSIPPTTLASTTIVPIRATGPNAKSTITHCGKQYKQC